MIARPDDPLAPAHEETERDVDFSQYWSVIVKRWRLIALCIGVALAAGFTISALAPLYYRATVVISVERETINPSDIGIAGPALDAYYYSPEFLPTQMRLMKSREIVQRVVQRLNLTMSEKAGGGKRRAGAGATDEPTPDQVIQVARGIQSAILIAPIPGTTLVELSFTSGSAKLAADIANALADSYTEWTLESRMRVAGQASQFLSTQIEQLKSEIDDRERKLLAYGRSKDIVSMDTSSNVTLQKLETLSHGYTAAMTERVNKEVRYHELQTATPDSIADPLSGGYVGSVRTDLLKLEREYAEKLNLYKPDWPAMQELKSRITRGRQSLETAIQETVARAREQAKNDYLTALRREENLKSVLGTQKTETMTLNANAVEYNNLKVEVGTKRTLLDTMLKRQSETDVSSRLREVGLPNIRVVERALVPAPWRIAPVVIFSKYFSLGIVAAFILVLVLEFLDRSLKSLDQVEHYLKLPPLGIIPAVGASAKKAYGYGYGYIYGYASRYAYSRRRKSGEDAAGAPPKAADPTSIELLPAQHPRSTAAEAYRAVRTALLLSRAGGVKSIVLTSGYPGEGKTSTAVNLAIVLGQLGKKVILIDADLHKPRLHKVLNVSNRLGLVSILAENVELAKVVVPTNLPGVSIVPAGPASPNPSELLASEAMDRFLREANATFDFIVIDSPPVQAVSDALLLGIRTDGVVLCVKGGKTPREHVARVRDRLLRSHVRILGVLINNLVEDATGYGYKYYYYSEYGSGYGDARAVEAQKAQQAGTR